MRSTVGWIEFNGVELGNDQRVMTYLRRGLGDFRPQVPVGATLSSPDCSGYEDAYHDLYETYCPYTPAELACFCDATAERQYSSPAGDPAPWHDLDRPESRDFLGFQPSAIVVDPVLARSVTQRSVGGGIVGRPRPGSRTMQVQGFLHAATTQGLDWGEKWVTQVLRGTAAGCSGDSARFLPSCPDLAETEYSRFFRTLRNVGVIDGPVFTAVPGSRDWPVEAVTFQIAAGSEYLHGAEQVLQEARPLVTGDVVHVLLEGPPLVGQAAAIIRIWGGAIGTAVNGVVVTVNETSGGACPGTGTELSRFTLDHIPRDGWMELDSAMRTLRVRDINEEVIGSFDLLTFTGLWDWIVADADTQLCLTFDASAANTNPGTLLEVVQVDVEL